MRNKRMILIPIIFVMVLNAFFPSTAFAETSPGSQLNLISEESFGLTFELKVPWQDLIVEEIDVADGHYSSLSISDWVTISEAGAPALPYLTTMIGVPFGAEMTLEVSAGKAHTIKLRSAVIPAETQELDWSSPPKIEEAFLAPETVQVIKEDKDIYSKNSQYPGVLAKIVNDGTLRQQRVASIGMYPIQFNPRDNSLTIYESIKIEIRFDNLLSGLEKSAVSDSQVYEPFLENSLLNYKSAQNFRKTPQEIAESELNVISNLSDSQITATPWNLPDPAWRINVREPGFYQLTYSELANAGLPVDTLDPRNLQLFHLGEQVAIEVLGEQVDKFNENDKIIFFGEQIASKYTADNVYWLTIGSTAGLRMELQDGTPGSATIPTAYNAERHFENNVQYVTLVPGSDDFERFMWSMLYPPSTPTFTYNFSLLAPSSGLAQLTVSMLGFRAASVTPDHHVRVSLNGTVLGDVWWDGIAWKNETFDILAGILVAGTNTITLTALNDTGVGYDIVFLDWMKLDFQNSFTAENNQLSFSFRTSGQNRFEVKNFTNNQLFVYDVSNPMLPIKITNIAINKVGSVYSAIFQDEILEKKSFVVTSSLVYKTVNDINLDTSSSLQSADNGVDYIIITHSSFTSAAQDLADYRSTQNLRTMVVDVQDIYDEFGYGIEDPYSIKSFLQFTFSNWVEPAPSYVLLLGDGHFDPKNFMGFGRESYIPPFLAFADPGAGETAADNRYVTLVGEDTLPDMMLGRLSVNESTEAAAFVNKIISYEQTPVAGDWQTEVLAVADNTDSAGNFPTLSNNALNYLPDNYIANKVYLGVTHSNPADARTAIQTEINEGVFFINYFGHAEYTAWASEGLFKTLDVPSLTNHGMQPVILAMTCREGYFHFPNPYSNNYEALGEVVTRAEGKGAIASWSSSGLGVATGHARLIKGFYNSIFENQVYGLGEATISGKLELWSGGSYMDLLDTYHLFGDPALHLAIPFMAIDDQYQIDEDNRLTVSAVDGVLINDFNPENWNLTAILVSSTTNGDLLFNSDGSFEYLPNVNFSGLDTFTYIANNGLSNSNVATVSIIINPVNDPPILDPIGNKTIPVLSELIFTATATDPDLNTNIFYFTLVGAPENAYIRLNSGEFHWTPTEEQGPGDYTFDVCVSDGQLSTCETITVTVTLPGGAPYIFLPLIIK